MLKLIGTQTNEFKNSLIKEFYNKIKNNFEGTLYYGFPVYTDVLTSKTIEIDAILISNKGVLAIHIPDEKLLSYSKIQDSIYNLLEVKFKSYSFLVNRRNLTFNFDVVSLDTKQSGIYENVFADNSTLAQYCIDNLKDNLDDEQLRKINSALQQAYGLSERKEFEFKEGTKSELIHKMVDIIEEYDESQMVAILTDPEGIQRIRGMAGSGKTIILAKKVVELHTKNPDWRILVTYNTRSLKNLLTKLITKFYKQNNNGKEPNFENLIIKHGWGSEKSDGFYYEICKTYDLLPLTFTMARQKYGYNKAFDGACRSLLDSYDFEDNPIKLYDCILIDEAQDFPQPFYKLCLHSLDSNQRLVYAYDELQKLNEEAMQTPQKLFGKDIKHDTPLKVCYRNQSGVIVTAHAFGMGLYRDLKAQNEKLIQIPASNDVWDSIGYISDDEIIEGQSVTLKRSSETSPDYLNVPNDELINLYNLLNKQKQFDKLLELLRNDIESEKIPLDEIIIIDLDMYNSENNFYEFISYINKVNDKIPIHLAGVRKPEDFKRTDSIVYSNIYRAKGNEAYMVYILNAQMTFNNFNLLSRRNSLFTAMTRSKGWVNILGFGDSIPELVNEFKNVKLNKYTLNFSSYPTESEKERIRQTNVDVSDKEYQVFDDFRKMLANLSDEQAQILLNQLTKDSHEE